MESNETAGQIRTFDIEKNMPSSFLSLVFEWLQSQRGQWGQRRLFPSFSVLSLTNQQSGETLLLKQLFSK